jgi:hypothetical protein
LKKKSATLINPKSESEWQALVAADNAVIITDIRGSLEQPEMTTVPGTGRQVEKIVGFTYTIKLTDFKVSDNWNQFYRDAHKATEYMLYFECDGKMWSNNGEEVSIMPGLIISENTNEYINVNTTIKWTSINQITYIG